MPAGIHQITREEPNVAINVRVDCVSRTESQNPHERIGRLGGVNPDGTQWNLSELDAIDGIRDGTWRFWTTALGKSVWVVIATRENREYLTTESDGLQPNNLLALPECP